MRASDGVGLGGGIWTEFMFTDLHPWAMAGVSVLFTCLVALEQDVFSPRMLLL